jgi:hypothetical protein
MGDSPQGYLPSSNVNRLADQSDLTLQQAGDVLHFAGFIYDRVTEHQISVDEALTELEELAQALGGSLSGESLSALRLVLDYKAQYEKGRRARQQAVASGPQFLSMSGTWRVQFHSTRTNEFAKVPLLGLTINWVDGAGNTNEFVVNLDDSDWKAFNNKMRELSEFRESLKQELDT